MTAGHPPTLRVRVRSRRRIAADVLLLTLAAADGGALPRWSPGAHVDLVLPSGLVRQYSLCGSADDTGSYAIAVLLEPSGRGGSAEIHERVAVGTEMEMRGPRNHFELVAAGSYLFVAGGIGVTPIVPMITAACRAGAAWRLVYGGRTRAAMAFADELERLGRPVQLLREDLDGRPDLDSLLGSLDPQTLVYCCGPTGLLDAMESRCADRGLSGRLHMERFAAAADAVTAPVDGDTAFDLELSQTGVTVRVDADRTIRESLEGVVPDTVFSCTEGYCGTCEVLVLAGTPDHRDSVASAAQHEAEQSMIICVGRSKSPRLVIDL